MFGLINRGSLSKFVEQEFENLIARLQSLWLTEHNEDGTHRFTDTSLTQVPVGGGCEWYSNTPPTGWVICDGSQLSRIDYKALFDVIGTTYGVGDGSTTFNIPDRRQRFGLGKAAAGTGASLAGTGGAIDHTHSGGSLSGSTGSDGAHTHTISGSTAAEAAHTHGVSGNTFGVSAGTQIEVDVNLDGATDHTLAHTPPADNHSHSLSLTTDAGSSHSHAAGTLTGDSGGAHTHGAGTLALSATGTQNPPYLVVNYIIFTGRA